MHERLAPVAGPDFLTRQAKMATAQDILLHPLLDSLHPLDWNLWSAACGIDLSRAQMLPLTDYNIVLQAAIDGQGIAMGRLSLLSDKLQNGQLVQVLPMIAAPINLGYWLITARHMRPNRAMNALTKWLEQEVEQGNSTNPAADPKADEEP